MNALANRVGIIGAWLGSERLRLPLLAMVLALAEFLAVRVLYVSTFGPSPSVGEGVALPLGHAILLGLGLSITVTAVVGIYRLVRDGRTMVWVAVVPLVCVPLLIAGLTSIYSSLIMLAIL